MATENENNPPAPAAPQQPATGITQAELHAAIEKARNEERTKLRAEIETANEAAKAAKAEVDKLTQANQKLAADLQTIQTSLKPEGGVDVTKVIEDTTRRANEAWQEKFLALEAKVQSVEQDRQRLTIEQTKARLIQLNGGESALIPSMVHGSTEAELLASIERSKAEFNRIKSIVGGTQTPPSQQQHGQGESGTPPTIPAIPAGSGAQAGGQPQPGVSPRRMSREEYAKNRNELKRQAVSRYPTNVITQR
jgi:hypothetical protein